MGSSKAAWIKLLKINNLGNDKFLEVPFYGLYSWRPGTWSAATHGYRMIRDRISGDLKAAIDSEDFDRAATLRLIMAAVKDRDIAAQTCDNDMGVADAEVMGILQRMIVQREKSALQYEEAGQLELAESERDEMAVIRSFLPRQMSEDEQRKAIADAISTTGAKSVRDISRVMTHLKNRHFGKMDFSRACEDVKDNFRSL